MSKSSEEFTKAFSSYTKALDALAVSVAGLVKSKETNVISDGFELVGGSLDHMIESLKKLTSIEEKIDAIGSSQDSMNKSIENLKDSQSQGNIFGQLENAANKKSIMQGVKSIILIAGGILAIGAAFKLIGEVNFTSVFSLAVSLPLIAFAVSEYAKAGVDTKIAFNFSASVAIIASGMVAAAWVFRLLPSADSINWSTITAVSVVLGIMVIAVSYAKGILKEMKVSDILLLPLVLPMIALGLTISAGIFSMGSSAFDGVPGFLTITNAALAVGLSAAILTLPMILISKFLKPSDVVVGGLMVIGLSAVLMVSSLILSQGSWGSYPDINWSLGFGLSMIAVLPAVLAYGALMMTGIGGAAALLGVLMIPAIAAGIVLASNILASGNYTQGPSLSWASGFSLLMLTMTPVLIAAGLAAPFIVMGSLSMKLISNLILEVDKILGKGDFSKPVPLSWSAQTAASFLAFGPSTITLGALFPFVLLGTMSMRLLAEGLIKIDEIFSNGDFSKPIPLSWTLRTAAVMMTLGTITPIMGALLPFVYLGTSSMSLIAESIVNIDKILSTGEFQGGPSLAWSTSIGMTMTGFSLLISAMGTPFLSFFLSTGSENLLSVARTINATADILNVGNFSGGPDSKWSEGVGTALVTFGYAMSLASPGVWDFITGNTFDKKMMGVLGPNLDGKSGIVGAITQVAKVFYDANIGEIFKRGYPSKEWSEGVGIAIGTFANALSSVGDDFWTTLGLGSSFSEKMNRLIGSEGNIKGTLVEAIVNAAMAFNNNSVKFSGNYPNKEWSEGVGMSLTSFATAMELTKDNGFLGIGGEEMSEKAMRIRQLSQLIVEVSNIVQGKDPLLISKYGNIAADYKGGPKKEWIDGIISSFKGFAEIMEQTAPGGFLGFGGEEMGEKTSRIRQMAVLTTEVSMIFSRGTFKNAPERSWSDKINYAFKMFAGLGMSDSQVSEMKNTFGIFSYGINSVAEAIIRLSAAFKILQPSLESFREFSQMSVLLSIIDQTKLDDTMSLLLEKMEEAGSMVGLKPNTQTLTPEKLVGSEEDYLNTPTGTTAPVESVATVDPNTETNLRLDTLNQTMMYQSSLLQQLIDLMQNDLMSRKDSGLDFSRL